MRPGGAGPMKRVVEPSSRTGVAPVSDFEPENGKYEPRISRISRMINGFHLQRVLRTHPRSEEHTSELQSLRHLVCRLLLEKNKRGRINVRCYSAGSTGRRNTGVKSLCWGFELQGFPFFFFFIDPATTEICLLSLHDALPI